MLLRNQAQAQTLRGYLKAGLLALYVTLAGFSSLAQAEEPENPNKKPIDGLEDLGDYGGGDFGGGSAVESVPLPGVTVTADRPVHDFGGGGNFISTGLGISSSSGLYSGDAPGSGGRTPSDPATKGGNQQSPTTGCTTSNPVVPSNGNKIENEVDFMAGGLAQISLIRRYNRFNPNTGVHIFGWNWTSNFDFFLTIVSSTKVTAYRNDGSTTDYTQSADGTYRSASPDADTWLVNNGNGTWTLKYQSGALENYSVSGIYGYVSSTADATGLGFTYTYNAQHQLQYVTHTNGQTVQFTWTNGLVTSAKDPAGNVYSYGYNSYGVLTGVTYPGTPAHTKTYFYEDAYNVHALTGIAIDGTRYGTFSYYANSGPVYQSGLMDGTQERITFSYAADNSSTTMTNAAGAVTTQYYSLINSERKITQVTQSGITNCPNTTASIHYDAGGHPDYSFDQRGIKTTYQYSSNGLLQDIVTGIDPNGVAAVDPGLASSQQRETVTTWDMSKNRVTEVKTFGASQSVPVLDIV